MRFSTLSGELVVVTDNDGFFMDFPAGKIKAIPLTKEIMQATNNLAKEAYFDDGDMVVMIENEEELKNFVPDGELISKLDGIGFIVSAPSKEFDFVSRCFYPKLNVLEDPVTGRAHTFLSPIWAQKLNKDVMIAKQISDRGGIVNIMVKEDHIYLGGKIRLFMRGEILEGLD